MSTEDIGDSINNAFDVFGFREVINQAAALPKDQFEACIDDFIALLAVKKIRYSKTALREAVGKARREAESQRPKGAGRRERPVRTIDDSRPEILVVAGEPHKAVDQAESVLLKHTERLRLYQRSGELVRIISLTREEADRAQARDHIVRAEGSLILHPLNAIALQDILNQLATWERYDKWGNIVITDCPAKVANTYLSRMGFWKLPHLEGVIQAPIMRPDGTIFNTTGYDLQTGFYLDSAVTWPSIPDEPTRVETEEALRILLEPFSEFPFVAAEDRAVLAAAILTSLQRRLLESAPLFGFSAPAQRYGKTLQIESVGIIATGRIPPSYGVARENEEIRKIITSILREGHLIAHLENVTYILESPDLARAISKPRKSFYSDRLLATNTNLRLKTNLLWAGDGVNLTFRRDMTTRAVLSVIDAGIERPEERKFKIEDLPDHLLRHRKELVAAALTVLKGYRAADSPPQNLQRWGGFNQWTHEIRDPLVWLGCADPCKTRDRIIARDPERELNREVLTEWHTAKGDAAIRVRDVIEAANELEGTFSDQFKHKELRNALLMVAEARDNAGSIDARRLGNWCSMIEDRVIGGLRLIREQKVEKTQLWRVRKVDSGGLGGSESFAENEKEAEIKIHNCDDSFGSGGSKPCNPLNPSTPDDYEDLD
jgi:hypothetical protein